MRAQFFLIENRVGGCKENNQFISMNLKKFFYFSSFVVTLNLHIPTYSYTLNIYIHIYTYTYTLKQKKTFVNGVFIY